MGDIKRAPVLNRRKFATSNKARLAYMLIGCVIGAVFIFGISFVFREDRKLISFIEDDFREVYILSAEDVLENRITPANIDKIGIIVGGVNKILKNSGRHISEIYKFVDNNVQWLFRNNDILALMPKSDISEDFLEAFLLKIEGEIKKDFNISEEIYRNTLIFALIPSKNSQFQTSIYYTLNFKGNILVSNNINLMREVIDKVLSPK